MNLNRRDVLQFGSAAAAASTVGLSGCLSGDDDGATETGDENDADGLDWDDGDYPSYGSWLPAAEDAMLVSIEWDALEDLEAFEAGDRGESSRNGSEDVENALVAADDGLLSLPTTGAMSGLQTLQLVDYSSRGLGRVVDATDADSARDDLARDDLETSLDRLLVVNGTIVCTGDVETDELEAELTTSSFSYDPEFDPTDEIGEFAIYELDEAGVGATETFAVSPDAVVYSSGSDTSRSDVVRVVEAKTGERNRFADEIERFGWLLETVGEGEIVFAQYGDDETDDSAETDDEPDAADGFASALTFDGDGGASAEAALVFTDGDGGESDVDEDEGFGHSADDVEFGDENESQRGTVSATWDDLAATLETGD
ncbi:hypothetical protein [Natronolimnohabitans innermongolicus]|uniref:Uncharacterized protein n=1 Tax=Natronolimnohabitans innermongolicus JCM 12255 TaxID=1227499 RepID=L9WIU9_9EURY|nr:hypothetical protein [Natronolimnohabitans innermongolicus]ELY49307.1 hypothetical protein C493_20591 [Natronolimnohabitans innermongolicus JCM 12255]